jgi:hypothetical protein
MINKFDKIKLQDLIEIRIQNHCSCCFEPDLFTLVQGKVVAKIENVYFVKVTGKTALIPVLKSEIVSKITIDFKKTTLPDYELINEKELKKAHAIKALEKIPENAESEIGKILIDIAKIEHLIKG